MICLSSCAAAVFFDSCAQRGTYLRALNANYEAKILPLTHTHTLSLSLSLEFPSGDSGDLQFTIVDDGTQQIGLQLVEGRIFINDQGKIEQTKTLRIQELKHFFLCF